jgi:hypothetical protein
MALKIIGAGYPRTGTSSLKLALEQLGFGRCHHMREVLMNPSSVPLWVQAANGHPDWEAIFDGYGACTDAPACTFWRELIDYYPSAKVILSVRDPEAWFESTQATVFSERMLGMQRGGPMEPFFDKVVNTEFGDRIHDREFMLAQFERHRQAVVATVPKDRLLVYDVSEGWAPLCAFLGVPVPETPFPHSNSRQEMAAIMASIGEPDGTVDFEKVTQAVRARFGPQ